MGAVTIRDGPSRHERRGAMRNEEMEMWADKVREHFPPPAYRVELKAFETELWVVDERTHKIAELDEEELFLDGEAKVYDHIRQELAS
jgi:hypothetical protein